MLIVDRYHDKADVRFDSVCFNLTLEMLIVDRQTGKRIDIPALPRFNLTLEMLIVDRHLDCRCVLRNDGEFQSHT